MKNYQTTTQTVSATDSIKQTVQSNAHKIPATKTVNGRRAELLGLMALSGVLDILLFAAELPVEVMLFGTPLILDELLELGISVLLGRNRLNLKWYDKLVGFLPIPGVTAITVRAGITLLKSFSNPDILFETQQEQLPVKKQDQLPRDFDDLESI